MRFRGLLFVAAVAIGTVVFTTAITVTGAQAGTGPARAAAPDGTLSDIISPSRSSGPSLNTSPFPPGPPTDLTATRVTTTSVTLTWAAPTSPGCCGVAGYDILYLRPFNDLVFEQHVGNVTTATITPDIFPTTEYRFWVVAEDSLGHRSTSSDPIQLITPIADTGDTTPPPAPTHLTATGNGTSIQLSWTPPADTSDVTGYNVYSFEGLFVVTLVGTTSGTTFMLPVGCSTLDYFVRARDAAGNVSIASNQIRTNPDRPSCGPSSAPPKSPSSSPPPPPPTCRVSYANAEWPGGFVANVSVTNTGSSAIDSWVLTYRFAGDQQITGAWGGTATQSGSAVTFRNAPWDAVIAPGATAYIGTQGTWHTSDAPPTAFAVNGAACTNG